jgi:hypothetical protein
VTLLTKARLIYLAVFAMLLAMALLPAMGLLPLGGHEGSDF